MQAPHGKTVSADERGGETAETEDFTGTGLNSQYIGYY